MGRRYQCQKMLTKKNSEWKSLDQQKKNLERIQKEGGASAELHGKAVEATQKAQKQRSSQRSRGTRNT